MKPWNFKTWLSFWYRTSLSFFLEFLVFNLSFFIGYLFFRITFFLGNVFNKDKPYVYLYWEPVPVNTLEKILKMRKKIQVYIDLYFKDLSVDCRNSLLRGKIPEDKSLSAKDIEFFENLSNYSEIFDEFNLTEREVEFYSKIIEEKPDSF